MTEQSKIVSKVLVLDSHSDCLDRIKVFCDSNGLVGLKVQADSVMAVLRSNLDLGAILLSETVADSAQGGIALARKIHAVRPELPIFLRRDVSDNLDDIPERDRLLFSAVYTIGVISKLEPVIEEFIFSRSYPNALVRGITEIAIPALQSQFREMKVEVEAPHLVRDRLIFGEIFTLIPLESSWCRGYMMLQTEEDALMHWVKSGRTFVKPEEAYDFRNLNGLLGEITNLIWGAVKNRYLSSVREDVYLSQVPIIINNLHRYISFGSDNPQLCFKYTVLDANDASFRPLVIQQKFVFNLNWSPEDFSENVTSVDELVSSGELEFF
jgi:hypothetical protein